MEKREVTKKIVSIVDDKGGIERSYKTVQTVIVDGADEHVTGTRDIELTDDELRAEIGVASAETRKAVEAAEAAAGELRSEVEALQAKIAAAAKALA